MLEEKCLHSACSPQGLRHHAPRAEKVDEWVLRPFSAQDLAHDTKQRMSDSLGGLQEDRGDLVVLAVYLGFRPQAKFLIKTVSPKDCR